VNKVAHLSAQDRRDIFSEAAAKRGIRPTIIEKDFWVCFVLRTLFVDSPYKESLVFKGGTSLSKVYGLIDRFSEDIDLVLDWKILGFGAHDPTRTFGSKTKQNKFNREINEAARKFIAETLCPQIDELVKSQNLGLTASVDADDLQVVNIHYPAAFSEGYIRPEVRLEIGPLASWVPSSAYKIQPYLFDVLPGVLEDPDCPVVAIAAERTFWEKATILHQEAHREAVMPQRHSRHYYDLYKLALSPVREAAFTNLKLLKDVVDFKKRFYPSAWARYDLAIPGSFKLLPATKQQINNVDRDYEDMQIMLFGEAPRFSSILSTLKELESAINSQRKVLSRSAGEGAFE